MITAIQIPSIIYSSENNIIWKLSSNRANLVYIQVELKDVSDYVLGSFKFYLRPDMLTSVVFDLQKSIDNLVTNQFTPMNGSVSSSTDNLKIVKIVCSEYYVSSGSIVVGSNLTLGNYFFWKGKLNALEKLSPTDFYLADNNKGKFLTHTKLKRITSNYEGRLNFICQHNSSNLTLRYVAKDDTIISSVPVPVIITSSNNNTISSNRFFHFNTSYAHVLALNGNVDLDYYRVEILRGATIIDSIAYAVEPTDCKQDLNVIYLNSYGGWETINLFSVYYEMDVNNSTMQINPFKTTNNVYDDYFVSNGTEVFNVSERMLESKSTTRVSGNTMDLKDSEVVLIKDLLQSKQVYLKINGRYFPAIVEDKKVSFIPKSRNGKVNFRELKFRITNELF